MTARAHVAIRLTAVAWIATMVLNFPSWHARTALAQPPAIHLRGGGKMVGIVLIVGENRRVRRMHAGLEEQPLRGDLGLRAGINLWLGLYSAPGEWPSTYMLLVLIWGLFVIDRLGRVLEADALIMQRYRHAGRRSAPLHWIAEFRAPNADTRTALARYGAGCGGRFPAAAPGAR